MKKRNKKKSIMMIFPNNNGQKLNKFNCAKLCLPNKNREKTTTIKIQTTYQ